MKTVRQLLAEKKAPLTHVAPDTSVGAALKLMAEHNVGSVLVLDNNKLVGIFTERDYARAGVSKDNCQDRPVHELMVDKVIYVTPERTTSECMAIMTDKRCRHLPVLDDQQQVIGIVSIGDVVKEALAEQQFIIEQLVAYIAG